MSDVLAITLAQYSDEMLSVVKHPLPLSNVLTIVQVIDASLAVSSVVEVMQATPSDQWLKYLLVHNILTVYTKHFAVESIDNIRERMLHIDPKLLQILYNVFIDDQCQESENGGEDSAIGLPSSIEFSTGFLSSTLALILTPHYVGLLCPCGRRSWQRFISSNI